jgi:hypothetical protein
MVSNPQIYSFVSFFLHIVKTVLQKKNSVPPKGLRSSYHRAKSILGMCTFSGGEHHPVGPVRASTSCIILISVASGYFRLLKEQHFFSIYYDVYVYLYLSLSLSGLTLVFKQHTAWNLPLAF